MTFEKILVPTDFSDAAERALETAAALASKFSSTLILFHAYSLPAIATPDGVVPLPVPLETDLAKDIENGMTNLGARARALGVTDVRTVSTTGDAWREIVRTAHDEHCDLIVIGRHGRSRLEHLLLGSVTEKVMRKAECAVLTVPAQKKPASKPT